MTPQPPREGRLPALAAWQSRPGGRHAVLTLIVTASALLAIACSGKSAPPGYAAPQPTVRTPAPESASTPANESSSPPPSRSVSPTPSRQPSTSPSGSPSVVMNLAWYTARLPKFGPLPPAEAVNVDGGASSPVWFKVPTSQKVAFLTIDDGATRHRMALPLLKASGVRVTLFLNVIYAQKSPDYFRALQAAGAVIENHTITHTSLRGKTYDVQKHEICDAADQLGQLFGRRPTLFRPPYGNYDDTTLRVARECNQKVVVYWTETVDKGVVRYQTSNHTIQPGHIVLMHFRPAYPDDFLAALTKMKQSGVQPALLEDYVQGACTNACRP